MSIDKGEVKYEPTASGHVAGTVTQSGPPQKGGSALDRVLDRVASKGQEMTGQSPSQGSSLERALAGPSDAPGLTSGPSQSPGISI